MADHWHRQTQDSSPGPHATPDDSANFAHHQNSATQRDKQTIDQEFKLKCTSARPLGASAIKGQGRDSRSA